MSQQYVSIRAVIGKVIGKLRLPDVSSTITQMADWAVDAELKIGSKNSYERVECELDVENYRACLPMGFIKLIALKLGNNTLEVTMREFRQFNKALAIPLVPDKKFLNGNLITSNPGQPNVHQIDFLPIFNAGDVITISVVQDGCGDSTINAFTYVVLPADTILTIIAAFVSQINTIVGLPYTAVPDSQFFQIIALNSLVNLQVTTFTDSLTGSISHRLIARRIQPTVATPGCDDDNCEVLIPEGSANLAQRSAAMLNDGMTSQQPFAGGSGHFNSGGASKFSLDNGFAHFNAIESGKVGIAYWGIRLDEEGWPMIYEGHVDAVAQYIIWQYDYADFRDGKRSQGYMQSVERRWYVLCAQSRGDDEMPDAQEMIYLANQWNQLLPLPNKNLF